MVNGKRNTIRVHIYMSFDDTRCITFYNGAQFKSSTINNKVANKPIPVVRNTSCYQFYFKAIWQMQTYNNIMAIYTL